MSGTSTSFLRPVFSPDSAGAHAVIIVAPGSPKGGMRYSPPLLDPEMRIAKSEMISSFPGQTLGTKVK